MPTINTKIWMALRSGVQGLPISPMPEIAWPGSTFEPVAGSPFLAIGEVYTAPRRAVINRAVMDRSGSITVTAVWPIGQDPAVYREISGKIADHFTGRCLAFQGVKLTLQSEGGQVAYAAAGYRDGGWWRTPVICPWRTWA